MSNIINSQAYVKQGDKVYKVNGGAGSPIHTFNSVEEMNAANLADGSIACVPSPNNVIDLTKYNLADGTSFNLKLLQMYGMDVEYENLDDDGSIWIDIEKCQNPIFAIDFTIAGAGEVFYCPSSFVVRRYNEISTVSTSFVIDIGDQNTRVTLTFYKVKDSDTGTFGFTAIRLAIEVL